eukprot:4657315-Pleurochrysis_carterae.AAC.1
MTIFAFRSASHAQAPPRAVRVRHRERRSRERAPAQSRRAPKRVKRAYDEARGQEAIGSTCTSADKVMSREARHNKADFYPVCDCKAEAQKLV